MNYMKTLEKLLLIGSLGLAGCTGYDTLKDAKIVNGPKFNENIAGMQLIGEIYYKDGEVTRTYIPKGDSEAYKRELEQIKKYCKENKEKILKIEICEQKKN